MTLTIEKVVNTLILEFDSNNSSSWHHASSNERKDTYEKQPHYTLIYLCRVENLLIKMVCQFCFVR